MRLLLPILAYAFTTAAAVAEEQAVRNGKLRVRQLGKEPKVTICHRGNDGFEETLTVNGNALAAHIAHGDYEGECRERSCAEQCNHQPCVADFFEDLDTGVCTCISDASPTICGTDGTATCDMAMDECVCPSQVDYLLDIDGNCRERSCAAQCNHQPCVADFFEDPDTGVCTCIPDASPTTCGTDGTATCDIATEECVCPNQDDYFFDIDGNCVEKPPCNDLTFAAPVEDSDGSEDPCPDDDCLVAFPCPDTPGAVIPFSEYDPILGWGGVTDVAKACPDGLTNYNEGVTCILPLCFSTDGTYDGATKSAHVNLWLFPGQLSIRNAETYLTDQGVLKSATTPNWSGAEGAGEEYVEPYRVKGFRYFARPDDDTCPLAPSWFNHPFTGRNILKLGQPTCQDPTYNDDICSGGPSSSYNTSPPATGYLTFQGGLHVSRARPLELEGGSCPCWGGNGAPLPTTSSNSYSCSWSDNSSVNHQIFIKDTPDLFSVAEKTDFSKICTAPGMDDVALTDTEFLACADQLVKQCNDFIRNDDGVNRVSYF